MTRQEIASLTLLVLSWLGFGLLIGLGISFLYYAKLPRVYESRATVKLTSPAAVAGQDRNSHDDSLAIIGKPNVTAALRAANLLKLPEFRYAEDGVDENRALEMLLDGERLSVDTVSDLRTGAIVKIGCRAATPSSAQEILNALVISYQRSMPSEGDQESWNEALQLLSSIEENASKYIELLEEQKNALATPLTSAIVDSELISNAMIIWEQTKQRIDERHQSIADLTDKIETLASTIDKLKSSPQIQPPNQEATKLPAQDTESKRLTDMKRKVDQKLAPMQRELDVLLQRLGNAHPTVVALRAKMDVVRSQLDTIDNSSPKIDHRAPDVSLDPTLERANKVKSLNQQLALLTEKRKDAESECGQLLEELDQAAIKMTRQQRLIRRLDLIEAALEQQHQVRSEVLKRLAKLGTTPPFASSKLTVLSPATRGEQVAPELRRFLSRGATWGAGAGFLVSVFMVIVSLSAIPSQKIEA